MTATVPEQFKDLDQDEILAKEAELVAGLAQLPGVLVAYSAGVDSTYLLAMACQALGSQAIAVTADSPSLARSSLAEAEAFCSARGIAHLIVATDEFEQAAYRANTGQRCYECKAALFRAMQGLRTAQEQHADHVLLLGALVEDFADYRPGLQAAREAGAQWPLADAGLSKREVRYLSWRQGLASWDRPAEPCLSSRIPYGERVTESGLAMIEAAEAILHQAGFAECRARHHRIGGEGTADAARGFLCRIEVPTADLPRVLALRERLLPAIRKLGYAQVTVDLGGLQSGGFNKLLSESS